MAYIFTPFLLVSFLFINTCLYQFYINNVLYQNVKLDFSYIPIFYYSQDSKSNQWWIADFLDLENLTFFVVELALLSHNHLIILESGSLPYLLQKCFHPLIV